MDQFNTHDVKDMPPVPQLPDYYSVEVALDCMQLAYQFKLWRSNPNSLFLLIKENSAILPKLKVGNILPMKYFGVNAMRPSEVRKTQIQKIVNEKQGRFKGHHRVELAIIANETESMADQQTAV